MMRKGYSLSGFFLYLLFSILTITCVTTSATADLLKVPELKSRVTDLTRSLSASEKAAIESSLENLEKNKGSQLAVLMVKTTSPEVFVL